MLEMEEPTGQIIGAAIEVQKRPLPLFREVVYESNLTIVVELKAIKELADIHLAFVERFIRG